jgi:hypothetical protein
VQPVASGIDEKKPALQVKHPVPPELGWYCPGWQSKHGCWPLGE